VGEQWASLLTSTSINSEELGEAVKDTWAKVLKISQTDNEIGNASSAISHFIISEVDDTKKTALNSKKLINEGELINGLWYLSTHLIKNTDDNLGKAVQESELINNLAKITAITYGGSQGAAAYASWYAYKETKDPEMALKVGIMSGASNAGFSAISSDPTSISQRVKDNIITGVMAGLSAAVGGGDAKMVKDAFLQGTEIGLSDELSVLNLKKEKDKDNSKEAKKMEPTLKITNF